MNIFSKITIATLTLSSNVVLAGSMGAICTPGNVTVPCAKTGWGFGVQALYLQPSYSNTAFDGNFNATIVETATSRITTSNFVDNVPAWTWSFRLEASYYFNTGNDFNVNWYHLTRKTSSDPFNDTNSTVDGMQVTNSVVSIQPEWDAVNFEFGQHVDFSERKKIRFHGGAQYARIYAKNSVVGTELDTDLTGAPIFSLTSQINQTGTYNGFGPRLGIDMSYLWDNGIAIYANGATALLIGQSKFTRTGISNIQIPDSFYTSISVNGNKTAVVPELEGKLGLNYTYVINQGKLTLDAGYLWVNYFNARTTVFTDQNFSVQGPFIGAKWAGNLA